MEFFHLIKATQKSGKQDAVIWFTAKSEARAALQLDVELEEAGIETGRGKDYAKPIRTDMPVCNDLPEEGAIDYTWCERYALAEDGRTWNVIPGAASQSETTTAPDSATSEENQPAAALIATDKADVSNTVPVENRSVAGRFAVHLLGDKYQTHITNEQMIDAMTLSMDDGNSYFQNLLQAKNDVADIGELSLHAEWKLVQAVKDVFSQGKEHEPAMLATFMSGWIKADDRHQLVEDWKNGKSPLLKASVETDVADNIALVDQGLVIDEHDDEDTRYPVVQMPFRKQLLAQFTADELRHHVTREEFAALGVLEMDTDNSYVQNLLLAAESCPELKSYDTKDLWRYTDAIRKVFSQDKRHELAVVLQFTKIWVETEYIDRGLLVKEWLKGNRVSQIQRTETKTNAGGGNKTDRNPSYVHTLDTLDIEIALATLPMDFNIYDIPGGVYRRAKEIVSKKEKPFKEWSEALRKTAGILDYSRAAIFALIRGAKDNVHHFPVSLQTFINANLTESNHESPSEEILAAARHTPEVSWESEVNEQIEAEKAAASQPQVANLGSGVFSIDGLTNEIQPQTEALSPEFGETTSDVQMEKTHGDEVQNGSPVPASQDATGTDEGSYEAGDGSDAVNIDTGHQKTDGESSKLFTHLMLDIETMGKKPGAPVISIGAVFFSPDTGETGGEFYQVISLESCMSFGAVPDASTILWWMKQSAEARSGILVDDAVGLVEALEMFDSFIADNAANGSRSVQLWGNGSSFDCTLIEAAFELADIPFPIGHWNYRDVRTVVEMGKAVGLNCRYDIPFEGDQHHALADARHQVKYVSAIWQHLTAN